MNEEVVMRSDSTPTRTHILSRTLAVLVALGFSGASLALANTASGSQNQELPVSVSLASQGTRGTELATAGDTVNGYLSLTTNMDWGFPPALEEVKVILSLALPSGESVSLSPTLKLPPEQTNKVPFGFTVPAFLPPGTYALTVEAIEVDDPGKPPSSATATITLY
jgi:hypothetical protein